MWIRAHVQHWNGKSNLLEWDAGGRLSDSSFGALQPFRSASRMTAMGRQRPGANRSHRGRLTDLGPKKSSLNSGGVDFCRLVFLIKRIRVRVLGSTRFTSRVAEPAHDPRRQRSDRDDEPCATARVRAHGASRKSVGARHDRRRRFRPGRTPVARMMGSAARSRRKFSALQSLENSQNAERIAIFARARSMGRLNAPKHRGGRRDPRVARFASRRRPRADRRSFEPRRFGRRDRSARG